MKQTIQPPSRSSQRAWLWGMFLFLGLAAAHASPPTISVGVTNSITDKQTFAPFSGVMIQDPEGDDVTFTISFPSANGTFPTSAGFTFSGGVYTYTTAASPGVATTFLQGLVFTPTQNRITIGTTELTQFSVSVTDTNSESSGSQVVAGLDVTPVNDSPTVSGAGPAAGINDQQTSQPFSGVAIADVDDNGAQPLTVLVSQNDPALGAFSNLGGFFNNGGGVLSYSNVTAATVTAAMHGLTFTPTNNHLPTGQMDTNRFTISVDDGVISSPVTDNTTTLLVTSLNDAPVIAGAVATPFSVFTGGSIEPFTTVVVTDADRGDDETETNEGGMFRLGQRLNVEVSLVGSNEVGQLLTSDFTQIGASYLLADVTATEATLALSNIVYQAPNLPLATTNDIVLAIKVDDNHGAATTNNTTTVEAFTPFQVPLIQGTQSGRIVSDKQTVPPFSTVAISSFSGQPLTVQVTLDDSSKGDLVNLGNFVRAGSPPVYSFNGTAAEATAAIRQLLFQPVENRVPGGTNEVTTFTIRVSDPSDPSPPSNDVVNSNTTTVTVPVNDRPTLAGISPLVTITDAQTNLPFHAVLIGDVDEGGAQLVTVTITLDDSQKGALLPLAGVTSPTAGQYQFSGTPSQVTSNIQQLVFKPAANHVPVGQTETTTFTLLVADSFGGQIASSGTRVIVYSVNGAPDITVPSPQPLSLIATPPVLPFQNVTVSDEDNLTVTLAMDNDNKGVLTNLGAFVASGASPATYTFQGDASNATVAIQGIEFVVNDQFSFPAGAFGDTTFYINAVDSFSNAANASVQINLRVRQKTFIVGSTNDYDPDDPNVPAIDKAGTLRKAVEDAGADDLIVFDLPAPGPGIPAFPATIRLVQPIVLKKNLTVNGPGADLLALSGDSQGDGTNNVRVFEVQADVILRGLTIRDGMNDFAGGGISVAPSGSLTLSFCAVIGCEAGLWGGGVDVDHGALEADHCLFYNNRTSVGLGQGGGAVSIFSTNDCLISNSTFSGNQQAGPSGLGGGGLYAETSDPGVGLVVRVLSCTFKDNRDAADSGTSIRPNISPTMVLVMNTIVADGQGRNLEADESGRIISLGGNISDDSTMTIFSQGGAPYAVTLFDQASDQISTDPLLADLADNKGGTLTHALQAGSPAIDHAILNVLATDQRGYWRGTNVDAGAFQHGTFQRVVINEILFDPVSSDDNDQFIEFYVPRDAETLDIGGFQLVSGGVVRHVFTSQTLQPGDGLVLKASAAVPSPSTVASQVAASGLNLDHAEDVITLLNAAGQPVLSVRYVGDFEPPTPAYANQSVDLIPEFAGFAYIPHNRLRNSVGASSPGEDVTGAPLGPGNAPPIAVPDFAATDENSALPAVQVLANDLDPDRLDVLRVVTASNSTYGAAVTINNLPDTGASVSYDPSVSSTLQALPLGSDLQDTFTYIILDYLNGTTANSRGSNAVEIAANLAKATTTVTVTVTGVNDPPVPNDDQLATTEDAPLTFTVHDNLLTNDTDPDTDDDNTTLRVSAVGTTAATVDSFQTTSALGADVTLEIRFDPLQTNVRYDPTVSSLLDALSVSETITDTFYYAVVDSHGATGVAAVEVVVTGVNDVPAAADDLFLTDEDTALPIPFLQLVSNDTDVDTDDNGTTQSTLQLGSFDTTSAMGATISATPGGLLYNPSNSVTLRALARNELTNDTFSYQILDGAGGMSQAVIVVQVLGVNDTPMASGDSYATTEDGVLPVTAASGVLVNDIEYDVNGSPPDDMLHVLPYVGLLSTQGADVTINSDGSFDYDPTSADNLQSLGVGQHLVDTFDYTIIDGSLTVANDDAYSVKSDSVDNPLRVMDNDVILSGTGGTLVLTGIGAGSNGGVAVTDSTGTNLLYTPQVNFFGTETFTYSVADGKGGTDMATVTVRVLADKLNTHLVANNDIFTVARGTSVPLNVLANDRFLPATVEGLSFTQLGVPDQGGSVTPNPSGDRLIYTPNTNFTGIETFTYEVTGGGTSTASATVLVMVLDQRNALNNNDDIFTVLEDGGANSLDVLANDSVLPGPGPSLNITGVNTNGVFGSLSVSTDGSRLRYAPAPGFTGVEVFSYDFSDGAGGTATAFATVNVVASGFNADDDAFTVPENAAQVALKVLLNDNLLPSSGETLFVTTIGLGANAPNHGGTVAIDSSGTQLLYTPAANFTGPETFTYEISAGGIPRAEGQVTVNVIDRHNALFLQDDFFNVAKDSVNDPMAVLVNDPLLPLSAGFLTITSAGTPSHGGTVVLNGTGPNNSLFYTPAPGFVGDESFTYQVADTQGGTGTATVNVHVGELVTNPDSFSVLSDSATTVFDVLENDNVLPAPGSLLAIWNVDPPDHGGALSIQGSGPDNRLVYAPAPGFFGLERFRYYVTNLTGGFVAEDVRVNVALDGSDRSTATVMVDVTGVNDPPVITGTRSNQTVYYKLTIRPFSAVTIVDVDQHSNAPVSVTVTLDSAAKGYLDVLGGFVNQGGGVYFLAPTTPANATATLRALNFVPTTGTRVVPGTNETTFFTLSVDDGVAPPVVDTKTSVIAMAGQVAKLPTVNLPNSVNFGQPVAVNGDIAVVGAPFAKNVGGQTPGALYVFQRNLGGTEKWGFLQLLMAPDGVSGDQFGFSAAVNGTNLVVGAPQNLSAGAAYLFQRSGTGSNQWILLKKLVAADGAAGDNFGVAVSLSGATAVVGANNDADNGNGSGSVYLFEQAQGGVNQWGQLKKIVTNDSRGGDAFGSAVSLDGNVLAVGAPGDDDNGNGSGTASVFERNYDPAAPSTPSPNNWGRIKKLLGSQTDNGDTFGFSVSVSGNLVAVGSPFDEVGGTTGGAAYVFDRNFGATGNWGEIKRIVPTDVLSADEFGNAVALDGDTVVVGSHFDDDLGVNTGSAYVFRRDFDPARPAVATANLWGLIEKFLPYGGQAGDHFGYSLAINANTVVVGSSFDGDGHVPSSSYVFRLKYNNAPAVTLPLPDQLLAAGTPFSFTLPTTLFADPDVGDNLSFNATLADGSPLPSWVSFNPLTLTFSGTPTLADLGSLSIRITVVDFDAASASGTFATVVYDATLSLVVSSSGLSSSGFLAEYDGQNDLYQYAFGGGVMPEGNNPDGTLFAIRRDPATGSEYLVHGRRRDDPRLHYTIEVSSDLQNWAPAGSLLQEVRRTAIDNAYEKVLFYIKPGANSVPRYFRVKLSFGE